MWLAPIAELLVLTATATPAGTASSVPAQALPEPVATRQMKFAIPFRIDPADHPSREPVEVQLFVSGNRGATWQRYWKVEPSRRRFMFQAAVDGEFWFMVRTLDRSGRLWPQQPNLPELRVVVDTMPPKLMLEAERGQAGQITARWQIDDPHPNPASLTIQYRTTSEGPWQQVAVDRPAQSAGQMGVPPMAGPAAGSPQTGQVIWWPQAGSGPIQIRAEVSDAAGNVAVSHAVVQPGPDTPQRSSLTADQSSSEWHVATSDPAGTQWPAQPSTAGIGADYRDGLADSQSGAALADSGGAETGGSLEDRAGTGYAYDAQTADRWANYPYPDTGGSQSTYPGALADTPSSLDRRDGLSPPTGSLTSSVNPPIQSRYVAPGESEGTPPDDGLPPGQRPRMVNSREFQLEYDVTSVGPSGISRVELWGTQDGGRSWRRLALDDDNRSPLRVKVDREGTYGLKVVVTNGAHPSVGHVNAPPNGQGGGEPQGGELPEIVVGVDLTKPTARITAAKPGTGAESGNLVVSWQADDLRLAPRPISLLMSDRPGGPWTPLASGLENTGQHTCAMDQRAPQRVYLRLEVRDEAGNVGVFEMPEPVSLDRFRPSVQIRDVRPLGEARRQQYP